MHIDRATLFICTQFIGINSVVGIIPSAITNLIVNTHCFIKMKMSLTKLLRLHVPNIAHLYMNTTLYNYRSTDKTIPSIYSYNGEFCFSNITFLLLIKYYCYQLCTFENVGATVTLFARLAITGFTKNEGRKHFVFF